MKFIAFTYAGNTDLASTCLLSGSYASASQSVLDTFFLCSQRVSKYADTKNTEFQSNRRNILLKIHANIFVLKSSSLLKCVYRVSQLLLSDPSDIDNHFHLMNSVSVNFSSRT
jgi:hypothetical protein